MVNTPANPSAVWSRPPGAACRLCGAWLRRSPLDLGNQPLSHRTVGLGEDAPTYPIRGWMCDDCLLVQVADVASLADLTPPEPCLSSRSRFNGRVADARDEARAFLEGRRKGGRRIAAFGAAARGSMMLNVCRIGNDLVEFIADPDPAKHGRFSPGCHIPIVPLETLLDRPPDDVLILPWTRAAEVATPLEPLRPRGVQMWAMLPRVGRV